MMIDLKIKIKRGKKEIDDDPLGVIQEKEIKKNISLDKREEQ